MILLKTQALKIVKKQALKIKTDSYYSLWLKSSNQTHIHQNHN